jgi:hypothetical protein
MGNVYMDEQTQVKTVVSHNNYFIILKQFKQASQADRHASLRQHNGQLFLNFQHSAVLIRQRNRRKYRTAL